MLRVGLRESDSSALYALSEADILQTLAIADLRGSFEFLGNPGTRSIDEPSGFPRRLSHTLDVYHHACIQ
jgi:hypothetical protein